MSENHSVVHMRQKSAVKPYSSDSADGSRRSLRLFKRCDNPTLPARVSLYSTAKRLEYDGDIAGALDLLYRAMQSGERVDSCMKDIAGLLNMMGRTREAVEFLKSHRTKVTNEVGYSNLLSKLEGELDRDSSSDLPRGVTVSVLDKSLGPVTLALCDRLFPNPAKIRRIMYTDEDGFVGAVHFASHSGARKALQVHKTSALIECNWSSLFVDARLRLLEKLEEENPTFADGFETDPIPAHLVVLNSVRSIPIYRETDNSLPQLPRDELERVYFLTKLRQEESSELSVVAHPTLSSHSTSPIRDVSPFNTPSSNASSDERESLVLSTILANHQHLFGGADSAGI